jgi:hypothetical protein
LVSGFIFCNGTHFDNQPIILCCFNIKAIIKGHGQK